MHLESTNDLSNASSSKMQVPLGIALSIQNINGPQQGQSPYALPKIYKYFKRQNSAVELTSNPLMVPQNQCKKYGTLNQIRRWIRLNVRGNWLYMYTHNSLPFVAMAIGMVVPVQHSAYILPISDEDSSVNNTKHNCALQSANCRFVL